MASKKPEKKSIAIYTQNPENEIWDYIADFESDSFVRQFTEKRIATILTQNQLKAEAIDLKPIDASDTDLIVSEVNNNAKQARDFYMMAKDISYLSRPIMLFYSFEKLATMLTLLTYKKTEKRTSRTHGISFFEDVIKTSPSGLFPLFHSCYSSDAAFYKNKYQFSLEEVIDSGNMSYLRVGYNLLVNKDTIFLTDLETKERIQIREIDREFIFVFALSILARYRVNEWDAIISGGRNNIIAKIHRYLYSVQLLFPNLILNELYGKIISFYEPMRLASVEIYDYDTPLNLFD
jgi:hypothetical protein